MRRRGGRKRAIGTRRPMVTPLAADQRWSLDFVSDQLTDGRRFRILAVVDDCTRECLALIADTSIAGRRVARELDEIVRGPLVSVLPNCSGWRCGCGFRITGSAAPRFMRCMPLKSNASGKVRPGRRTGNYALDVPRRSSYVNSNLEACDDRRSHRPDL